MGSTQADCQGFSARLRPLFEPPRLQIGAGNGNHRKTEDGKRGPRFVHGCVEAAVRSPGMPWVWRMRQPRCLPTILNLTPARRPAIGPLICLPARPMLIFLASHRLCRHDDRRVAELPAVGPEQPAIQKPVTRQASRQQPALWQAQRLFPGGTSPRGTIRRRAR